MTAPANVEEGGIAAETSAGGSACIPADGAGDDACITRVGAAAIAVYPPGATYGPRAMREYEFVWMLDGDAEYRWGAEIAAAPCGSIVLCRPGATDFFQWDTRRRTRHAFFHFDVLRLPSDWPPPAAWPLVRQPPDDDILRPLFRHLLAQPHDTAQGRLIAATMLSAFVTGEAGAALADAPTWPEPVERAWTHLFAVLEENPGAPLCLDDLAAAACVTPEHLCRVFQMTLGRSPMEAVRLARLDRAATLLTRSNSSVSEIARFCGFATPFHFARLFKAAYGKTPTEVRAAAQQGAVPPLPRLLKRYGGAS